MNINKVSYKTVNFLFEAGTLRKLARSHRQRLLTDDLSDNIASHSFRVSLIGYILANLERADVSKVLLMCLFHDVPEARSNDLNWVHKKYVKVFENEIINDQLVGLPNCGELKEVAKEFNIRTTKESRIAKDADNIDQVLLLKEYYWAGNREAESWLKSRRQEKLLYTDSAKYLLKLIYKQEPGAWTRKIDR